MRAQPTGGRFGRPVPPAPPAAPPPERPTSLQSHLAIAVAERLLTSDRSDDRVRGVERLVASGQREAIDRLVRALSDEKALSRDGRARLAGIRGLAAFASREAVRLVLGKALADPGAGPLSPLVRDTSAMALAASEDARALEVLVDALRRGGPSAATAERALLAYPPKSLGAFLAAPEGLSAAICNLFGRLDDARAIGLLRGTLARGLLRVPRRPDPQESDTPISAEEENRQARVAAALALARLGDQEQVPVAQNWVGSADPWLKLKGAEVLLLSRAPDGRRAIAAMILAPPTRSAAVGLAAQAPAADLLPALAEAAKTADDPGKLAAVLVGRIGGPTAVAALQALMKQPARAWEAAFALARAPGEEARRAIEAILGLSELGRLAARAGTVRALALRDPPRGLGDRLRSLLASKDPADRAAGAFGLAALGEMDVRNLVFSRDAVVARAAARASLFAGPRAARACSERLANEKDALTRAALAIGMAGSVEAFEPLSTLQLAQWAEADEPLSALAVVALGSRDEPAEQRRLRRFLESGDPVLRAHAAFALALSPIPDAASRLSDAWRFEIDATVRRAIAGCAGGPTSVGGCYVAWISLSPSASAAPSVGRERVGALVDSSGLSLPLVTDPDGALLVVGVSPGISSFHLASSGFWYDSQTHDRAKLEPAR